MESIFLTLNPEFIDVFMKEGIIKKAVEKNILSYRTINFREFAEDKHKQVDDTPYGGGSGMLLKPEPVVKAYESIELKPDRRVILTSPAGKKFDYRMASELSRHSQLIFICGRYEGVDERIIDIIQPEPVSIGDYVISNGELSSLVIFNAVARMIPGVLGNYSSLEEESFSNGILEYAQYTRPENFRGLKVPEVLLNGNHKLINEWRHKNAVDKTQKFRKDLLD